MLWIYLYEILMLQKIQIILLFLQNCLKLQISLICLNLKVISQNLYTYFEKTLQILKSLIYLGYIFQLFIIINDFCYYYLQMDLIDVFSHQKIFSHVLATNMINSLKITCPNFPWKNSKNDINTIQLNSQIQKLSKYSIICLIRMNLEKKLIVFRYNLIWLNLQKPQNHYQKILILKYFLQMNDKSFIDFNINPKSSDIALTKCMLLPDFIIYPHQIIDFITENLLNLTTIIRTQLNKILILLHKENMCTAQFMNILEKKSQFLKNLKTYIKSSSYYSWKILSGGTERSDQGKPSGIYSQTKRLFRYLKKKCKFNEFLDSINSIYKNEVFQKDPFVPLGINDDNKLKDTYLQKNISICKDSKQLQQIEVQKIEIQQINLNDQTKLKIGSTYLKTFIHELEPQKQNSYELDIIRLLQKREYRGIPKYYFIKNKINQTKKYSITNLVSAKSYSKYLESNNQTISLHTKINLLKQIICTLKYLRDHQIVYNNLRPENLKIKKGLVKLFNYSNAYHHLIFSKNNLPIKCYYPFVSVASFGKYQTIDDERSDVYSLGAIIYYTLYGKNHLNLSTNKSILSNPTSMVQLLRLPPLICLQKCDYNGRGPMKQLTYFCLMALNHQKLMRRLSLNFNEQAKKNSINLKQRPYLDWTMIIVKYFQQNLKNHF